MSDIHTRPFSKNYSGLINQTVIAIGITVLCVGGQELMKRVRRGKSQRRDAISLGSRESWEFGYLYQGRSWARYPSSPSPRGWPLSWVPQVVRFPEDKLNELRGLDAVVYIRFLRGCFWFTLLHVLTTFLILFPIHLEFSEDDISPKSMTRASISSLVGSQHGKSLLWIHICLLFWITLSWIATLFWIIHGAFRFRARNIAHRAQHPPTEKQYYPHPHPQYHFTDIPPTEVDLSNDGLRFRTIMVTNIPPQLRDEKELQEYFEYYMSRKLEKPAMGVNSTTQPGFINKSLAFILNHAKRIPVQLARTHEGESQPTSNSRSNPDDKPAIERVIIARKMTELSSLLERREDILRLLETAHIKLARKALVDVARAMKCKEEHRPFARSSSRAALIARQRKFPADVEVGDPAQLSEEERMDRLIKVLGPFVEQFGLLESYANSRKGFSLDRSAFRKLRSEGSHDDEQEEVPPTSAYPPASPRLKRRNKTVWDALLSLPRNTLDAYQPLVNLSHLFRGKTVPSIDYYTAKLNLLTSLITENRAKPAKKYDPVSTAFVTFAQAEDARRACNYLAVHPHNPLTCIVTMAPQYSDLDWIRVMKSSYNAEFVKDWVVSLGVWAFTLFWLFPVSLFVGLVSIQNISVFWHGLGAYLEKHAWEAEVLQSFIPTLLVALLALLIPLILLLIAKKAHTILTLSSLHDRIMTRYFKFLIVNVLVFFCVGTAALQSVLDSLRASGTTPDVLSVVANSFPTAGPFYVGWLIFTLSMHGGFEIALREYFPGLTFTLLTVFLVGLPLIMYPTTSRQITPRKRAVGIRPRTLNFYYWLPTHLLVIHVLLLFSVLNPFVLPFGCIYFFVETGVVKNQLIHVYAKHYEGNGQLLLIRMIRYSLDGLILAQSVFLAYMVVLKREVNVGLAGFLVAFTAIMKIFITRVCRAQFEADDIAEAEIVCGSGSPPAEEEGFEDLGESQYNENEAGGRQLVPAVDDSKVTWRLPAWVSFSYATVRHRPSHPLQRYPIPFRSNPDRSRLSRIRSLPTNPSVLYSATPEVKENPSIPEPWESAFSAAASSGSDTQVVSPHPHPVPWDDQHNIDIPYDNPYYTRTISNALWLPRDPCGVLNLDETIDLKVSISVDPSCGQIGSWTGLPETNSPSQLTTSLPSTPTNEPERTSLVPYSEPDYVDGSEIIDLPVVLAKRAEVKDDVENTVRPRRPSTFRRSPSNPDSSLSFRRPSSGSGKQPLSSYRSFSETLRPPEKSNSIMSIVSQQTPIERSESAGESTIRPDAHAQAELVREGINPTSSRISLERPALRRAPNISANRAIYHEVLAEEILAFQNRMDEEQAEAEKTRTQKSWLTSWMFKKQGE
ncbi:hypothetical protein E1B28_012366 [Marasmius oreades]|uniref:DUF221-domain-containing protein n=1 Tax=Marasmius oreades TaxID=181124 RepID=A0A9P7RRJ8_9AGAR|nr:uncharacterized protein E1B28_012366 [Marasmius oreades]KAG7088362.1 hypothetical protein E1B28_012366 [Marasmius oreades]